jgi:uncharacterized protein (TIGR04222 family)
MIRRGLAVLGVAAVLSAGLGPLSAWSQTSEVIHSYHVAIRIQGDGTLAIAETIDYDFGTTPHHGIFRDVPTTLRYDDTYDRRYPLHVVSVSASRGASADYTVDEQGGTTQIKVGDPDVTVTGRHVYRIAYTIEQGLNAFADHDELYWNAIGAEWSVPIERATATVDAPARIVASTCFQGAKGSSLPCGMIRQRGDRARFAAPSLGLYEGMTVVVSVPKGVIVPAPTPRLVERWSLDRAFGRSPATVGGSVAVLALAIVGMAALVWTRGRDRRFRGSPVDQVMGNRGAGDEAVPPFDADTSAPVEFAPPDGLRPGQVGTIVDERANTLDVTATIVDLAVRGFLTIEEIPKHGLFGKPDWTLTRAERSDAELMTYERRLLDGLFRDGGAVQLSSLRATFRQRLDAVEDSLYADAMRQGWFSGRPDEVRRRWSGLGVLVIVLGAVLTYVLARFTHAGLVGVAVVLGGLVIMASAPRMPARTPKGTAVLRRVRGFRTVIEKADTYMARWAEQENVFTSFLPYAIVFGCTEKWAKAFEGLAQQPDTSWYVSSRPFTMTGFARSVDDFTVTTGGTIVSTPSGSGGSGFSGGSSGGGGGGGGGGSW